MMRMRRYLLALTILFSAPLVAQATDAAQLQALLDQINTLRQTLLSLR